MKGRILEYNFQSGEGVISGDNGIRYRFGSDDWREPAAPKRGDLVDFVGTGDSASDVYATDTLTPVATPRYERSKVTAALLAFFLGCVGAHKFYLGYTTQGILMLVGSIVGWALLIVLIGGFILSAVHLTAFIEFIIYLTKSDEEFHETYVVNKRPWF